MKFLAITLIVHSPVCHSLSQSDIAPGLRREIPSRPFAEAPA
jgi:hypothetical protein